MNRIYSSAASAVVFLWSLFPVQGAPKPGAESTEAKMKFEQIEAWSANVADEAFRLGQMAGYQRDPEAHLEGLAIIKEDVNKIGSQLQSLEAERNSLSAWEVRALDQTLPLMQEVAVNAEKSIQTYSSDRGRLWDTSYAVDTATINKDADEVATTLRNYLALAKAREKEVRIEHRLGDTAEW